MDAAHDAGRWPVRLAGAEASVQVAAQVGAGGRDVLIRPVIECSPTAFPQGSFRWERPPGGSGEGATLPATLPPLRVTHAVAAGGGPPPIPPPVALYDGVLSGQDRLTTEEHERYAIRSLQHSTPIFCNTGGSVCVASACGPGFDTFGS